MNRKVIFLIVLKVILLFMFLASQLWIFHESNSFESTPNSFTNQSVGLYIDQWLYSSRFSSKNWIQIPKGKPRNASGDILFRVRTFRRP